ncbi:hypothetical protein AOLI_G00093850 [Acnodon oligacanthus]
MDLRCFTICISLLTTISVPQTTDTPPDFWPADIFGRTAVKAGETNMTTNGQNAIQIKVIENMNKDEQNSTQFQSKKNMTKDVEFQSTGFLQAHYMEIVLASVVVVLLLLFGIIILCYKVIPFNKLWTYQGQRQTTDEDDRSDSDVIYMNDLGNNQGQREEADEDDVIYSNDNCLNSVVDMKKAPA